MEGGGLLQSPAIVLNVLDKWSTRIEKRIAAGGLALVESIRIPALAAEPLASDSPWLKGNWAGKRNELSEQGFSLGLFHVNELATNVRGGHDQKTALETSDQTTALFNYDLSKKLGVDGEFSLVVTNRNNHELLTNTRVNDPRTGSLPNLSQEVWGVGSVTRLPRLTYLADFDVKAQRWSVTAGAYALGLGHSATEFVAQQHVDLPKQDFADPVVSR